MAVDKAKLDRIESMKLKLSVSKAKSAIEEIELRILEREIDIDRMREHIELQKAVIAESEAKIKGN